MVSQTGDHCSSKILVLGTRGRNQDALRSLRILYTYPLHLPLKAHVSFHASPRRLPRIVYLSLHCLLPAFFPISSRSLSPLSLSNTPTSRRRYLLMAPKRAKIVRTTKKVVEETVEVLGVAVDSHNSVNLPAESDSKIVEVVVEDEVPISVVVVAKDKKTEPETEQKQRAEEASLETEEPLPKQKGDEDDRSKEKEAAEFIVDMETKEEEGGDEKEEKGEEDQRVEKEAELPTPKKVEKRKEAPVKESKKGGKRRWRRRLGGGEMDGVGGGYKRYVFRVLKQVHPGLGISARAMTVVDCMMGDMFERLANEASQLSTYSGRATLSSREVQGAVQLVLPGELGKHAIAEGSKAVANYMAAASGSGY
ncbi:hypothetical protein ZIOFF_071370 [Zingiber officinale]|uniref:Core Histone H2A/H2B/H3 domain-containing protein n=2 Tax=Zingiber officinale TaxID=94328 RepID=A0A8J5C105_ZINOF|nr:hypothetical protein ZIOFF_071370 [Zingiber officinale]